MLLPNERTFSQPSAYVWYAKKQLVNARYFKQMAEIARDQAEVDHIRFREGHLDTAKYREECARGARLEAREALINHDTVIRTFWGYGIFRPRLKDSLCGKDFKKWPEYFDEFHRHMPGKIQDRWS